MSLGELSRTARLAGTRVGLCGGHIPGSINLPFDMVLHAGHMRSLAVLKAIFDGLSLNEDLIFSCGAGVTACIPALAAELIGRNWVHIYDGLSGEYPEDFQCPSNRTHGFAP